MCGKAPDQIRHASSLIPGGTVLLDQQATWNNVLKHVATATCVHFACHARFDPTQPDLSAMLLPSGERVGLPQLMDQAPFHQVRLVLLSACQTGLIEFHQSLDEVWGWSAVFHRTGAAAVLGTLWPVNDFTSLLFMRRFVELWSGQPDDPVVALDQARRWLATTDDGTMAQVLRQMIHESSEFEWIYRDLIRPMEKNPRMRSFSHPYFWAGYVLSGL